MMTKVWAVGILFLFTTHLSFAKEIKTNAIVLEQAPDWLKAPRVEKIIARIQQKLEWTIRRTQARYYVDPQEFGKSHGLGPEAIAVTRHANGQSVIHLGPKVTNQNFDQYFAHELVHLILVQKYKGSIPKWLEEGLANHLSATSRPDYKWLLKQPFPQNVLELAHPFKGQASRLIYNYKASQALIEMLAKKCNLDNLIRLSVERKMEDYIVTYCGIKDINKAYREWVTQQARLAK